MMESRYSVEQDQELIPKESRKESASEMGSISDSHHSGKDDTKEVKRYSVSEKKAPDCLTSSALGRVLDHGEPTLRVALKSDSHAEQKELLQNDVRMLKSVECWDKKKRSTDAHTVFSKFVLKTNRL